jgi:aspartate-semialdehyde dehydrogenase
VSESRIPVAVLGATGLVGQRLVVLLEAHPWFRLAELGASSRSAGKAYRGAVPWALTAEIPEEAAHLELRRCDPAEIEAPLVFSALDSSVAGEVESAFAGAGRLVVTNSRNHRMDEDVPLLIPEVNPGHLALLDAAREAGQGGGIVANPNCTVVGLALALAPLQEKFGIDSVCLTSFQALSGAGLPGPAALEALGNVLPHIAGEEEKISPETCRILGRLEKGRIRPAPIRVSAACHRVPVRDAHLLSVSLSLGGRPGPGEVRQALSGYLGSEEARGLPSSPPRCLELREERDRPQPRLDREAGGGMSVVVGPPVPCEVLGTRIRVLVHNTLRGAAGAALLNGELLRATGRLRGLR